MTRFITPHAGTIFGPAYQTKAGDRKSANGLVIAPLFITVPWDVHLDQTLDASSCENSTDITANLTQHTNYSCLSAVDMGTVYGTQSVCHGRSCAPSINYATWDGEKCVTCQVAGNSSNWKWTAKTGTIGYVRRVAESDRSYRKMMKWDMNKDGKLDENDMAASMLHSDKELEKAEGSLELLEARQKVNGENDGDEDDDDDDDDHVFNLEPEIVDTDMYFEQEQAAVLGDNSGGGDVYILKSFNYGGGMTNWTYSLIPKHLGTPSFVTNPYNESVIYTVTASCIAASYDTGDTWTPCWNQPPPPPAVDASGFHKSAGDLSAGHDINVANMTEADAETWCKANTTCSGFTTRSAGGADAIKKIYFKENLFHPMGADPTWVSYVKVATPKGPPPPQGHTGLTGSFGAKTPFLLLRRSSVS
jgi:hypothetical protein